MTLKTDSWTEESRVSMAAFLALLTLHGSRHVCFWALTPPSVSLPPLRPSVKKQKQKRQDYVGSRLDLPQAPRLSCQHCHYTHAEAIQDRPSTMRSAMATCVQSPYGPWYPSSNL
jgi:hypothetical protein